MKKIIFGMFLTLTSIVSAISFTVYPTRFEIDSKAVGIYEAEVVNNTQEPLRVTMYVEEDPNFGKDYNINENIGNQKGTELGYGKGDFVPDLTVNYTIIPLRTDQPFRM